MKPTRRVIRRSFISEVTGGFGVASLGGGASGKAMPPGDHDPHAPEKPGKPACDSDH